MKTPCFFLALLFSSILCFAQNDCVYIAGFTTDASGRQFAAYWKSGKLTKLTSGNGRDEARTIAISGSDVHVGGFKMQGTNREASYWKNGQEIPLNLTSNYGRKASEVYAIKVIGSDVYLFVTQPNRQTTSDPNNYYYYKNGIRQSMLLSDRQSVNYAMTSSESYFVSRNGDIYILSPNLIDGKVTYWKNGNRVTGSTDLSYLYSVDLKSIFVSENGDVYIAADKIIDNTGRTRATCWKNGNEIQLSYESGNTYAKSVYVEGNTVYVSGAECKTTSHFSAVYWGNGQKVLLHNYNTDGYDATTASIATAGGFTYVAGMHKGNVYWANGKEIKLDEASTGEVFAMAVVRGGGCSNQATIAAIGRSDSQAASAGAIVSELSNIWKQTSEQRKIYEQQEKERLDRVHAEQTAKYTEQQNKLKQTEEYKTFEKAIPLKTGKAVASNITVQSVIGRYIKAIGGIEN